MILIPKIRVIGNKPGRVKNLLSVSSYLTLDKVIDTIGLLDTDKRTKL